MGLARRDVLAVKAAVEVDLGVDLLHDGVGARREAPAPHLVAHDTKVPVTDHALPPKKSSRRLVAFAIGGLAGGVLVLAAVYGIGTLQRNPVDAACRPGA